MSEHVTVDSLPADGGITWASAAQRIGAVVVGAVLVGGGTMILTTNRTVAVHEDRIAKLETHLDRLPDIDKNVVALNGKVDVLNQKLDDAKETLAAAKGKKP